MSPVVGVVLMITLMLVLASTLAAGTAAVGTDLEGTQQQFDAATAGAVDTLATVSANPWEGEQGDLLRPATDEAGATDVAYRVNFTVEPGSSTLGSTLDSIELRVTNGSSPDMFSSVTLADIDTVAIDENSDGTIDRVITGDVTGVLPSVDGTELLVDTTGSSYTAQAGDSIIVEFEDVDNPPTAGVYAVEAQTSNDGNWHNGTITIV